MLRHQMSDLNLFCAHTIRPRPAYRPAVESLEERVALIVGFGLDQALGQAIGSALGQLGTQSTQQAVVQRAKSLSNRALALAVQLDRGQITFAEASRQITAMHKELFKLKKLPGAQNSRFRIAQEDLLIFKEFVQARGDLAPTNLSTPSLEYFITKKLEATDRARFDRLLEAIGNARF